MEKINEESNKTEITLDITNYCPHNCKFCSSNITNDLNNAIFLSYENINKIIFKYKKKFKLKNDELFDYIIISGGEPLAHPHFYKIHQLCKKHAKDVPIYTNNFNHIFYNGHIIDGIYIEANLTFTTDTDKIHILKRIKQGKEKIRPEVKFSKNWINDCDCKKVIINPNGTIGKSPCKKEEIIDGI